jgi:hypothetical protein
VLESGPPPVAFEFDGAWLSVETSGDRQVVARRCLEGPAAIRARGAPGPGTVVLDVSLPKFKRVRISKSCRGEEWSSIETGRHRLTLPAPGGDCEIRVEPAPSASRVWGGSPASVPRRR